MALNEEFKRAVETRRPTIPDDNTIVLMTYLSNIADSYTVYDFLNRHVTIDRSKASKVIPFDKFDRETLENMHEYLVSIGKNPQPLPEMRQVPKNPFI